MTEKRNLHPDDIYLRIYKENGEDYYVIRGLTFYTTCTAGDHIGYLRKIVTYAKSLQDENFVIHEFECMKPKINDKGVFALVGQVIP